jgi:hypothetical protein
VLLEKTAPRFLPEWLDSNTFVTEVTLEAGILSTGMERVSVELPGIPLKVAICRCDALYSVASVRAVIGFI